ncbi:MAG: hypothetical protein GF317_16505 [Candidatus Lokiarchaeota archaeon]|nr:hypothetical protein [Candidatus Lokiarchaeota archaeon]
MENKATYKEKTECLKSEIKLSLILYEKGMKELENLPYGLDNIRRGLELIYIPIFLLSNSLERLIKCVLCLILLKTGGDFKEKPYDIRKEGHDLEALLKRLIEVISNPKYKNYFCDLYLEVKEFGEDKAMMQILKALSDFGTGARYYNLDVVIWGESKIESPIVAWDGIEMGILMKTRGLDGFRQIPDGERMKETQKEIINKINKLYILLTKILKASGFEELIYERKNGEQ